MAIIKFLKRFATFTLPLIMVYLGFMYFLMPKILSYIHGPNTEDQITKSFSSALTKDYDVLILGNSRLYRGINPDKLENSSYNFGHDDDTYDKIYYKLKYLLDHKKTFDYLILGVDYFQFSYLNNSRNYVYGKYFDKNYLKVYGNKKFIEYKKENFFQNLHPNTIKKISWKNNEIYQKSNGQYIKPGKAKKNEFSERSSEILAVHEKYFEKTLRLAHKNNIEVYLVMAPVRDSQMKNYTEDEIQKFQNFINKYADNYKAFLNFSRVDSYNFSDYTDVTHLTPEAADRFSQSLTDTIQKLLEES